VTSTAPSAPDFSAAIGNPAMMEAAVALFENRLHDAEPILRAHLKADPFDVAAIRMMAELAGRIGRYGDAENLLRRAIELAPRFLAARSNLATVLYKQNRLVEAIAELSALNDQDPGNAGNANLQAAALSRIGDYEEAISLYEQVLGAHPDQPKIWMSYGHILKTVGRQEDCIAAYRRATAIMPHLGEVWWSLANLKTVALSNADIKAMEKALTLAELGNEDRFHLHFALGKAYEDAKSAATAFDHYDRGNRLRRDQLDYDAHDTTAKVMAAKSLFTPEFFAVRNAAGYPAPDPIFILGLPRAGSTLIEQILASHSAIEGTMELPDMPALAARAGMRSGGLGAVPHAELRAWGEEYIKRTQIQRKTNKPFFIDKLPNNWAHIGLIHSILPRARIIDARRHPLGCCFSNFKQHFARGQEFTYQLDDIGHYYRDYVALMAHFDAVLPGRIHRVFYEDMVADQEGQTRALIAHLDLPFESECLRFYENDRAVRTASSEQVRRPIFREGIEGWQMFMPWLEPLTSALGDVLTDYPAVPVAILP
jgi:tetratricopeptide (TPR) repeat protein